MINRDRGLHRLVDVFQRALIEQFRGQSIAGQGLISAVAQKQLERVEVSVERGDHHFLVITHQGNAGDRLRQLRSDLDNAFGIRPPVYQIAKKHELPRCDVRAGPVVFGYPNEQLLQQVGTAVHVADRVDAPVSDRHRSRSHAPAENPFER